MADDNPEIWYAPLPKLTGKVITSDDVQSPERDRLIQEIEREEIRRWLRERGQL